MALFGLLCANSQHEQEFTNFFNLLIKLRHLGFPTPILDWTRDPYVALFFAFSNFNNSFEKNAAIYRIKVDQRGFNPFGTQVYQSDFNFFARDKTRHHRQQSTYTLAIRSEHKDTYVPEDQQEGVQFYLDALDSINKNEVQIEKYIILNSQSEMKKILKELISNDYTHESLYGRTHQYENTLLRDLILQYFILND